MTESSTEPDDLTGTADDRLVQLASLQAAGTPLGAEWLRRQLNRALGAWAADETELDIERESRVDF